MGCICSKFDSDEESADEKKNAAAAAAAATAPVLQGITPDGGEVGGGAATAVGEGGGDDCPNHIVSLTSSTYGLLKLDPDELQKSSEKKRSSPPPAPLVPWRKSVSRDEAPEVIDARELMGDLEDAAEDSEGGSGGSSSGSRSSSNSSKKKAVSRAAADGDRTSETPVRKKLLDPSSSSSSPRLPPVPTPGGRQRRPPSPRVEADKENAVQTPPNQLAVEHQHHPPRRPVLRAVENVSRSPGTDVLYKKPTATTAVTPSPTPVGLRIQVPPRYNTDSPAPVAAAPTLLRQGSIRSKSRRRSLSPLFDPELVASWEKELRLEKEKKEKEKEAADEQIKRMVSWTPKSKRARDATALLETFEPLCPPGGENAIVLYTTTLRGIRKTFEDCNLARARLEAHYVRVLERDISMDSGYRQELRLLLGGEGGNKDKEGEVAKSAATVKVPALFVKGRYVGGAEEVVRLEEEGKLELLLEGVPREAGRCCDGCGGLRFVMCTECYGSCKVHDEDGKVVKCGECNENGLIHCPICC